MNSVFIFRQDLRINDNIWLYEACNNSICVLPIFIFDTKISDSFWWFDDARFNFLSDAVHNLKLNLQNIWSDLIIFRWDPIDIIINLVKIYKINKVFANNVYDRYWLQRDWQIKTKLMEIGVDFEKYDDYLIWDLKSIKPYKVFSPYFRTLIKNIPTQFHIKSIEKIKTNIEIIQKIKSDKKFDIVSDDDCLFLNKWHKYRKIDWYKSFFEKYDIPWYEDKKNFPHQDETTKLSPYIRFGIISVREVWNHILFDLEKNIYPNLAFEIARRNFWHQIVFYDPSYFELEFLSHRRNLKRENDEELFNRFVEWKTWYPIVDAGIIQLKKENRMHGRIRMVVASFLTKDLLIDRRWGEQFFKKYLLDYDDAVNVGNRQWSASVGADPKPIRIFSPIRQSQRFDPLAKYILKYIPELKNQPIPAIHDPISYNLDYHKPIVNHKIQIQKVKNIYNKIQ